MFLGSKFTKKEEIATQFAKNILCLKEDISCENCDSCIKFNSKNHPDFRILTLGEEENSIKIEQIRNMQEDIIKKPIVSNRKVYIIENADKMTIGAQNCLLKTLEEPPLYITIILLIENETMILNTIKSRCTKILFTEETLEELTPENKDSLYFITASEDKHIKIWDIENEDKSIFSFTSHSPILCMKIANDKIITANKEKEILVYNYEHKNNKFTLQLNKKIKTNHSSIINSIIILHNSKGCFIISSSDKIFMHEYNNKNKSLLQKLEYNNTHKGIIYKLEIIKKNKFLSCGADHVIKLWSYNKKESILVINDLVKGAIYSLQLFNLLSTTEEKILTVGTEDKKLVFIKISFKNYNNVMNKLGEYTRPENIYETFYLYKNQNDLNFGTISFDKANKVFLLGKKNE